MKVHLKYLLCCVTAAASPATFAADIEEVVVTASPFGKSADAVNKPVSVLTGESLKNASASTLGETLSGQLGVNSASFGPGVGLPVIRGQSDNRVKVMQDSVGSMDASAASPDHAVTLEPLLANRIEVLRGPAALRYGSGAIGGVVNVIDNRIPEKLPESIEGGVELRNESVNKETSGVASLNAALGAFAFHIDGVKRDSDNLSIPGYASSTPEESSSTTKGFIDNTDATSQSGTFGTSYINDFGFIGLSVNHLSNNYGVPPDSDERVRIDMHQTRYDLKGEINKPSPEIEKISLRVGHNDYKHTEIEEIDGVAEEGTQFTNDAYESRIEILHTPVTFLSTEWQGALGLQHAQSKFAAVGEEAFIPKSDIRNSGIFLLEETTQKEISYEFGVRADVQNIETESGGSIAHTSTNLSGTATWHFTETQKINLGLTRSQRAPSVEELLADGPHPATGSYLIGDENLNKETSTNVELGYHWHQGSLQFSTNIFYNHFKDFIYSKNLNEIIDELNGYQYTQANTTFKGVESEFKLPLAQHWNLRVFGDYVRAELDDGGDLPRITPMRSGASIDFDFNSWTASLSATHSAKQSHPGDNESPTASYYRLDANVNYHFNQARTDYIIFIKASNITDEEIRNASSYLRNVAPEAGRNFKVGLRVTF